ncbi:UDP-N-acetylmuramate dehydrogenase, partial [Thermodesulfobacteriota bacterium]
MLINQTHKQWLTETFGPNVRFQEPMSRHTSLRVGGPADVYVAPQEKSALVVLVRWLQENRLPYFIVGNGTNLLVLDNGIRGIVISMKHCLKDIRHTVQDRENVLVTAGAAARLNTLCTYASGNRFKGMNFALGIPGSVGGAIVMNAGTGHGNMADVITAVVVLSPGGDPVRIKKHALQFRYRGLDWKERPEVPGMQTPIILEGEFRLSVADKHAIEKEASAIMKKRIAMQPLHQKSAGCFFKNPAKGKSAGELIDLAGLKGKQIGDAQVSTTHANFIINKDKASAADILALKDLIQEAVLTSFNVT